jgi:hypothetical protein
MPLVGLAHSIIGEPDPLAQGGQDAEPPTPIVSGNSVVATHDIRTRLLPGVQEIDNLEIKDGAVVEHRVSLDGPSVNAPVAGQQEHPELIMS